MPALWKKSCDQPKENIKIRDITLLTKVCIVKALVFAVVIYGCESWTIKKAEHQKIDAFELWYWRRLLRVPWTARISNQAILKEISPEYSFEGLMLKLKLQYFGHLMQRTSSLEKTLMLGDWKQKQMTDEMVGWHHRLDGHEFEQALGGGDGQGSLACCSPWGQKESDTTDRLNWTEPRKSEHHLRCLLLVTSESQACSYPTGRELPNSQWRVTTFRRLPGARRCSCGHVWKI